jgi:hypothetical protein
MGLHKLLQQSCAVLQCYFSQAVQLCNNTSISKVVLLDLAGMLEAVLNDCAALLKQLV